MRFQRRTLVTFRLDQHIEDLALGIDGAPQIDQAAKTSSNWPLRTLNKPHSSSSMAALVTTAVNSMSFLGTLVRAIAEQGGHRLGLGYLRPGAAA